MHAEYTKENWLTDMYDYDVPKQGDIRTGILLEVNDSGALVDIGLKHDGIVPRQDIERLEDNILAALKPGQEVTTRVIKAQDQENSLLLSLAYIQEAKDWERAQELWQNEEIEQGQVSGYNRGGLLVKFGSLTGFVPISHLWERNVAQHPHKLKQYLGQELSFKIIEANSTTNRLVISQRLAEQQSREQKREVLLDKFEEGQTQPGIVTHLCDFGAFVDLGNIDGLIHISELAWRRLKRPDEVVQVGDEVEVYILKVDRQRKRIGLSLKRLQPNPWELVEGVYHADQLVEGVVTNVVDFGAFVALDIGIEGLLHVREIADPAPDDPREFIGRGDHLLLRILRIEPHRQRLELSLKAVSTEEQAAYSIEHPPA